MALTNVRPRLGTPNLSKVRIPPKTADSFYHTPDWTLLRKQCFARDGGRCVVCGAPAKVADHIVSRRNGGRDELGNLRSLCRAHDNRVKEAPDGTRRGGGSL